MQYHVMDSESLLVDNVNALRWTMATLLSLARRTGRIFIMPKVIAADGVSSLKIMSSYFRETNLEIIIQFIWLPPVIFFMEYVGL